MSKVMVITGASKGLGKYLAEHYLEIGCKVAGCSRSDPSLEHENYRHYRLDVADERAVTTTVKGVAKNWGTIDILINNAGIASMNHFVLTPLDTLKAMLNTNFLGTFLFTREVAKIMINKRWGRIVNVSSVAAPLSLEGESAYVASKSAVEALARVVARELAQYNITVNTVGAAPLMTGLLRTVPKEKIDKILGMMPISRIGQFRDVSNVIDFFVKDESDFITGQVIYLGGVS